MSKTEAGKRVDEIIDKLKLSSFADRKTMTYSGGQRRIFDLSLRSGTCSGIIVLG